MLLVLAGGVMAMGVGFLRSLRRQRGAKPSPEQRQQDEEKGAIRGMARAKTAKTAKKADVAASTPPPKARGASTPGILLRSIRDSKGSIVRGDYMSLNQ